MSYATKCRPVAILSALAEEQLGLAEMLVNRSTVLHAGRSFECGHLASQPVVLAVSKIGKVAAATTAAALIERFQAKCIVFTGVAGGLHPDVQAGDVVLGSHCVQHDMDATPLFPKHELPLYGQSFFAADEKLFAMLNIAIKARGYWTNGQKTPENDKPQAQNTLYGGFGASADGAGASPSSRGGPGRLHHGLIASGDQFIHSAAAHSQLCTDLPTALCVEMEGAAVAQVCHDYSLPFAAVRLISDRADAQAANDFAAFVKDKAAPFSRQLVLELLAVMAQADDALASK